MHAILSDTDLLSRLVGYDSTSRRSNVEIADFISDYLDRPRVRVVRLPNHDGTKINVIASIGPETAGPERAGLVLSGHLDVVPADEPDWTSDPFTLTEDGGTLVGRGACDMKGFDALAVNMIACLDDERLTAPLVLMLTYDEEVGSLGAQDLVGSMADLTQMPRATVIGEPTSLRMIRMHKGHLTVRVTTRGRSAHSGSPHLGHNAVHDMVPVLAALDRVRAELDDHREPTSRFFPTVPAPVMNIVRVQGGETRNVIPDLCTAEIGVRLLPGQDGDVMVARLRTAIDTAGVGAELEIINDNPPLLTEQDTPVATTLSTLIRQTESIGASFASDGGWLHRAGFDCVLFGPGSIEVAHRPDEFVPKSELVIARGMLERLVEKFCVSGVPT